MIEDLDPQGFGAYVPQRDKLSFLDKNYLKLLGNETKEMGKLVSNNLKAEVNLIYSLSHGQISIDLQETIEDQLLNKSFAKLKTTIVKLGSGVFKNMSTIAKTLGKMHDTYLKSAYTACSKTVTCGETAQD